MSFNPSNFNYEYNSSLNQYGWTYSTSDNISTVETSGYFSSNTYTPRPGDIVKVTASNDSRIYTVVTPSQWRRLATDATFVNDLVSV